MNANDFLTILWGALGTVITGLVTWLTSLLVSWLNTKIKNEKLKTFLKNFATLVESCVNSLTQTVVNELKKTGKFDEEAAKRVKQECINLIISQLSPEMKKFIEENFGNLTDYISTQIESYLLQYKEYKTLSSTSC